jgi:hypothetical protein
MVQLLSCSLSWQPADSPSFALFTALCPCNQLHAICCFKRRVLGECFPHDMRSLRGAILPWLLQTLLGKLKPQL